MLLSRLKEFCVELAVYVHACLNQPSCHPLRLFSTEMSVLVNILAYNQ